MSISKNILEFKTQLPEHITLIAVSKTKPVEAIMEAYKTGQRHFGENKIQEMTAKSELLPKDIHWHMIGHVQTNKVKYMAPYVHTVHAVDSLKLLLEINKQAAKHQRIINCLLQYKIASEDTKYGLTNTEIHNILNNDITQTLKHVRIKGLMGMASFTSNETQIQSEFQTISKLYAQLKSKYNWDTLSIGMSGDYTLAIANGSTHIRIGSALFGSRQ